jgi:hypothetical protein
MNVSEFREKIKIDSKLIIGGNKLTVKQIVRFRLDDDTFYIKLFLNDGYVFADDLNENVFILVKEVKTIFSLPFPEELDYDEKHFKFCYEAHAIAEESWGEEIFKKDDSERFWDYKGPDNSYLSLGINDNAGEKLDFYGKIVNNDEVDVK